MQYLECFCFSFEIISLSKKELVALCLLCSGCWASDSLMRLFLTEPCDDLQCVKVVAPGQTQLRFEMSCTC